MQAFQVSEQQTRKSSHLGREILCICIVYTGPIVVRESLLSASHNSHMLTAPTEETHDVFDFR